MDPKLSVIIPTFNNLEVLRRCLDSWERHASDQPVELLVVEDGCKDATPAFLEERARTDWGRKFLRWFHESDVHQLRCNNRGFREARAPLFLVWDDDMFLEVPWLVPELLETFGAYPDIGLLSLIRGMYCFPIQYPITEWEHLHDPRHMVPAIGPSGLNWLQLSEVDVVIRPWVVRRACIEKVGPLDEAFCPVEWDEADLCYRIRVQGGWRCATHDYERDAAFLHLGSTTLGRMNVEKHHRMVLPNGQLFHRRWDETIQKEHPRPRRSWWRKLPARSVPRLLKQAAIFGRAKAAKVLRGQGRATAP